ncbi:MAG: cation-transporting P-type ATPase, partial [Anaerolineales bacterium]
LTPPSPDQPNWACLGDQTEAALRVAALKGGIDEAALAHHFPRRHELPFDARRKRMSTIHSQNGAGDGTSAAVYAGASSHADQIAFVKGAPREVLELSTHILLNGQVQPLSADLRLQITSALDDYARNALRVLALARRPLPARESAPAPYSGGQYSPERVERGLTFLGLVAMMDPPRADVAEAVRTCRQGGIRLVMITGDYGLTAESIGRRVGIVTTLSPRILTGAELDLLSDADLQTALDEEIICARMAPEHKLRLVAAFQARGEVVAVIGDGVNDAPALRKADIGVTMGVTGTDVAKEAADVILTNDSFAAIVPAIEEGRAIYDNLRKFTTYIFASNVPEILPVLAAALFHIPLALTVTQILAIDLGTDLLPALALSTEKPEPNVMRRPPRRRNQPVVDKGLLLRAVLWLGSLEAGLCYLGFFAVYYLSGYADLLRLPRFDWLPFSQRLATPDGQVYLLATTVFHAGVVMAQIGNAFTCRTENEPVHHLGWSSNRFLLVGVAAELGLILLLIYFRPLAVLFEHAPLPGIYWVILGLFAPVVYGLDRTRKVIARRYALGRQRQQPLARRQGASS